ncbi:hypothetical protein ACFU6R_01055 [Streptomyces sp. NPDC057499]|uniref:hypothetical protein n=1 Tax=Streptomyces sp. NPDC057499 TaxID=3346150 RepID=UPI0036823850
MSTPKAWPDVTDKDALRAWMEARRDDAGPPSVTMAELRERQLNKLSSDFLGEAEEGSRGTFQRPVLRFALDGGPVPGHKIEAGVLGGWLTALQAAVSSVANALDDVRPTRDSGPVPKAIQTATKLLAGPVFASSYGMVLEGAEVPVQAEIPGIGDEQLLDLAVNRILDIAEQANLSSGAADAVLDAALPLGRRAISHLSDLSEVLASSGANATFTWQSKETSSRVARLSSINADRCRKALRSAHVEDNVERISGILVGGSKIRGFIELEPAAGNVMIVRAPKDEVTHFLASYAERRVVADVHVLTARSPGGREHRSYLLLGLELGEQFS